MSFLDGILGGVMGAEMTSLVTKFVEAHGGVGAIVSQFEQNGCGETIKSWVAQGPNASITPEQIKQALGSEKIEALAQQFGVPSEAVAKVLSEHLPGVIDKMTPQGQIAA